MKQKDYSNTSPESAAQKSIQGIKSWAANDRPREKLMHKGPKALSDAELLAILIGSGNAKQSAVELCREILKDCKNSLEHLAKQSIDKLMTYRGVGEAKAITIAAALELSRRRTHKPDDEPVVIRSSKDAFYCVKDEFLDLAHEEFIVVYLNRGNSVIHQSTLSKGGMTGTVTDIRLIYKEALEKRATGLILAHNHPSGNLKPSESDIVITRKIMNAGKLFDIQVMDHIIVANDKYYSFADNGNLE
jgi:DNA repair protein RadC